MYHRLESLWRSTTKSETSRESTSETSRVKVSFRVRSTRCSVSCTDLSSMSQPQRTEALDTKTATNEFHLARYAHALTQISKRCHLRKCLAAPATVLPNETPLLILNPDPPASAPQCHGHPLLFIIIVLQGIRQKVQFPCRFSGRLGG
jgi:hypothetical protein